MDAMNHIVGDGGEGRGRYPASCLHEIPPWRAGKAYASVCGEGYRVCAVSTTGVGADEAVGRCCALARVPKEDRGALFFTCTLAF